MVASTDKGMIEIVIPADSRVKAAIKVIWLTKTCAVS